MEGKETMSSYKLFLSAISKKRLWVCLLLVVYATLLFSSWNWLSSIVDWYGENHKTSSGWPAVFASVLVGAVFGVLTMAAAAMFIAVPAIVVIWTFVVVMMAFAGKSSRRVVVEGRKATREIVGIVFKDLLKEGLFCVLFFLTSSSSTLTLPPPGRWVSLLDRCIILMSDRMIPRHCTDT